MKDKQVEEIVEHLLKDKGKVWKLEEIEEYLKSYQTSNEQMITILECLVDDFIFKWLDFISLKLSDLATEKDFVNLLRKIIQRIKGDMAQGPFIRALIKVGEQNANLGFSLYKQMTVEEDKDLINYSCFPLGGAGKRNFDEAYLLINEGLRSENPHLKAACVKAIRVIFEDKNELQQSSEIFDVLNRLSSEQEDVIVQVEVLNAYFDFSRFRYEECVKHLSSFAERNNSTIRFSLASILWTRNLRIKEDEIEILKLCAEDGDKNVLSTVSLALSKKGPEFPEKSLRIIRDWIKRGKYFDVYEVEYSIREIGKVHLDMCIKEVETWIEEKSEDRRLQFFIPILLKELGSQNYEQLIAFMEPWFSRDEPFRKMALQTIRKVLTEIYLQTDKYDIIDSCFEILRKMAKDKSVNVERIIRNEPDRLFQCFRLVEELELERKEPDFEKILENLESCRTISDFLGPRWFKAMRDEKNKTHPLLILLSSEIPDEKNLFKEVEAFKKETNEWKRYLRSLRLTDMLRPIAFLQYLEEMLQSIVSKTAKLRELRAGLKNEDQFWETISEIEVISSFIRDYDVEIAPSLNNKKLDLRVEFEGKDVLIEVISPNMFKPLRYLSGKAIGIRNRAKGKIFDEYKAHLEDLETRKDTPIVIVIDIGRSEISYDFVEDYLMGTLQLTMLVDKKKGRVVKEYPSRADDSMHGLERGTNVLSAVICYKTVLGKDSRIHREGRIIPNAYAKNPLTQDAAEKIKNSIFR